MSKADIERRVSTEFQRLIDNDADTARYGMKVRSVSLVKSGGYRAIIIFRTEKMTYFSYAFPKSKKDDINDKEEAKLKARAKTTLSLTDAQIKTRVDNGSLIEVL
jgi:hypothetical protein